MVRPATTARMVAKATAEKAPISTSPPTAWARWITTMFGPPFTAPVGARNSWLPVTKATEAGPMTAKVMMNTRAMTAQAVTIERRAADSSGTVKNRIRRCGRPMTPRVRPTVSETAENGSSFIPPKW